MELAAGELRLEHVGGIERAFGGPGADHGVEFVDEQHDPALGLDDFLQHGLEALFELAAVLRTGHERPHVQGDDPLVLQALGHVAADDPLGEALHDGRLAYAGLTDEHGVVLGAAGQDLDDAPDLLVAADHWVELATLRQLGQVPAVLLEGLVLAFGILVGDLLAAADGGHGLLHRLPGDAATAQQLSGRGRALLTHDGQEQMLGADELILHRRRFGLGLFEHGPQARGDTGLRAAVSLGQAAELVLQRRRDRPGGLVELLEEGRYDAAALLAEGDEQVFRLDLRVRQRLGEPGRGNNRLLGLFRERVEIHD